MAPPTNKPRLRDINADALALSTAKALLEHVHSLVVSGLAPAWDSVRSTAGKTSAEQALRSTKLYTTVRALAQYAAHGVALEVPVREHLASLLPLYSGALGEGVRDVDALLSTADPETPLGLIIAAAQAREQLEQGAALLSTLQLALLASMSRRQVQQLVSAGELQGDARGLVSSAVARQWLASRDVPGVQARAPKPTTAQAAARARAPRRS